MMLKKKKTWIILKLRSHFKQCFCITDRTHLTGMLDAEFDSLQTLQRWCPGTSNLHLQTFTQRNNMLCCSRAQVSVLERKHFIFLCSFGAYVWHIKIF